MTTSTRLAHQTLIQHLLDNLPAGYTTKKVKLPNRELPDRSSLDNSKWLRTTIINQDVINAAAGGVNGWRRYFGLFVIDIFYPVGNDDLAQLAEAESIALLYENLIIGEVKCKNALINTVGEDGSWYNVQISIDFTYEGR